MEHPMRKLFKTVMKDKVAKDRKNRWCSYHPINLVILHLLESDTPLLLDKIHDQVTRMDKRVNPSRINPHIFNYGNNISINGTLKKMGYKLCRPYGRLRMIELEGLRREIDL